MKGIACWFGVLLLIVSIIPAMADSISPSSVTTTIPLGGSTTVTKTVTINAGVPTSSTVDVFFLADTTGSMGGIISSVAGSASAIMSATSGLGNVAWGVGDYKDGTPGNPDAYAYRLDQAITTNTSNVQAGINMWSAYGGYDYPESDIYGLDQAATDPSTGWRTGSARILVWMGDAPSHDPDLGVTTTSAIADLNSKNIKVEAMNVGYGGLDDYGQATAITSATGGQLFNGINTSTIVSTIENAITSAFATYSNVTLDASEAGPGVTVSFDPAAGYTGSYDRSTDNIFSFDVTFTGVNPGTDNFNIYALADGARMATESDSITVGGVPEPSSIFLLGSTILGLGLAWRRRHRA